MKYIFSVLVILFVIPQVFGQRKKKAEDPLLHIDKKMETILDATLAAGFSVAVIQGDDVIYEKGFGYRDYENKIPADEHTLYAIGSSTKAFTSSLLGMLRDEGKLDLDDNPRDYLSNLTFHNDELNTHATIKDFMCHRSGLPRHDFSWYFFPTHSRDSLLMRMEYQEPFTGLREQWYYNNFGFLIQGMVAEELTGKSWEENIDELIFTKLGMDRSNCTIAELEKDDNAAKGYNLKQDSIIDHTDYYKIGTMGPAGSINSSVHEMSNWVKTWIRKGKFGEDQIFPEGYAQEAISAQMVVSPGIPGEDNPDLHMSSYGYGWFLSSYRGHYRVEHGGNIDGFSANVSFFPSDSMGIVVLSNQSGSSVPYLVRNTIADALFGVKESNWINDFIEEREERLKNREEMEDSESSSKVEGTTPSHNLAEFAGAYTHDGYGTMNLFFENDQLWGTTSLGDTVNLGHHHYNTFNLYSVEDGEVDTSSQFGLMVNFRINISGEISGFELPLEPTIDPLFFNRKAEEVEMTENELEKYVGTYELAGTRVKMYTKDDNTLYALVPGQPEYELLSLGDHTFALKILDGFKVQFLEAEDGSIEAVNFIQPNGTFKAKKIE